MLSLVLSRTAGAFVPMVRGAYGVRSCISVIRKAAVLGSANGAGSLNGTGRASTGVGGGSSDGVTDVTAIIAGVGVGMGDRSYLAAYVAGSVAGVLIAVSGNAASFVSALNAGSRAVSLVLVAVS